MAIRPNPTVIRVSTNRPNLIYATHILVGSRNNLRNLDLILPEKLHPPMRIPRIVIFHGSKAETATHSQYINSRLPLEMQNLGICRHYHSDMSREYLEDAYTSFAEEEGNCLISNATAGAGEVSFSFHPSFYTSKFDSRVSTWRASTGLSSMGLSGIFQQNLNGMAALVGALRRMHSVSTWWSLGYLKSILTCSKSMHRTPIDPFQMLR
jgi:hypothetical protein